MNLNTEQHRKVKTVSLPMERNKEIMQQKNSIPVTANNCSMNSEKKISPDSPGDSYWMSTISEVKDYIRNNIKSVTSPEQVMERFKVDRRKFSAEFKMKTGKTINEFMGDTRFRKWVDVLENTPVTGNYYKIAWKCGYKDDRVVYNIVKKRTGKTPMEFHRELLKKKENL